jgi:hypothetical protein
MMREIDGDVLQPAALIVPKMVGATFAGLTAKEKGTLILNTTTSKLKFSTVAGTQEVTSA